MTSIPAPPGAPGRAAGRWSGIAATLRTARQVAVITHIHPDGDAVGSAMALVRILRHLGVAAHPILPDALPHNFQFLDPEDETCVAGDPRAEHRIAGADVIAVVDVSRSDRLGRLMQPVLAAAGRRICIDHHADGDFPAHEQVVDPAASSTGELVYQLGLEL